MASYNRVIVIGNLTRDPELRRVPSGAAVCELRLAISETFRNKEGQRVERPVFVDVTLWERLAEIAVDYLTKGSPVFIEGRLQYDEWKTPQDETRSKLRIVGTRLQLIGTPPGKQQAQDNQQSASAATQKTPPQDVDDTGPQGDDSDDDMPPF